MADKPLPDLEAQFQRSLERGLTPEQLEHVKANSVTDAKLAHYEGMRGSTPEERLKNAHLLANDPPRKPTPDELRPDPVRCLERK